MHPLLIVDDHAHIVEDIAGTIRWEELGVGPVYKAYSGHGALKVLEEHAVDIVMMDIKMPGMSGLELLDRIRSARPGTKCILLSGFAEFEYAKQAILAQISDYLLKPASNEEIIEVVSRVIGELARERESDEMVRRAIHTLRENLPRLHETLLLDVLQRRIGSETALLNKMRTYELQFGPGDEVAMLMIRLEEEFDDYDEHSVSLFEFAVCNITEEIFRPAFELWFGKDPHDYLVFLAKRKPDAGDADLEALAEQLQEQVRHFLKGRISILATRRGVFPRDIPPLYQQALFSFRQQVGSEREFFLTIRGEAETARIRSIERLY
ncbi:response regulator [Paenibacillus antri]|uniref:Response regulator n=1 Tax=Paenibacillus antri TaxID=2582848 RepID=A0A5R9GJW0_9BACL|nr:response regulator [Paenibacillus antri]TLS53814.1 response regulator [Paenibacillus antri]